MPQFPNEEPKSQRSVLQILGQKTGLASKVLLPDSDSEHGGSPVVAPGSAAAKLVPQGRGNYQLLGEIARGGMGVILKGHDTDLGRDVAVKVLDSKLAKRPEVVQRFVEEAQIGGQLQHPGIVPVYELGLMADESPYFTMKLVKGHTLASLFQQRKNPADNRGRLLAIFESVCQTVAYAHSKGVLHRDLKPANVMVGAFGEVQVVDWGLAKVLRRGGVADEKRAQETVHTVIETVRSGPGSSGSDSMVGSVMGTPAYMAPEQAQGEIEMLDERADVFSLGAILCELLTGKPPYVEMEGESILAQAGHAKLKPARERIEGSEADPALVKLALDCLMTAREMRPPNAAAVAKTVHEFLASVEERAAAAELAAAKASIQAAEERRARRLTVALAGTIAVALLLGGGGFWWVNKERARRFEQARLEVEAAQNEAIDFSQAGKTAEALKSAKRAQSLAESGGADAALLEHVRAFVTKAEQDVDAAARERALGEKDKTLLSRLIDLRLKQISSIGDQKREAELDAAFTKVFQDYGVDLEGDDLVPALKRIRERSIAREVALALDDWGRLRRKVQGPNSDKAENLAVLAKDLDPDTVRMRMREAIAAHDTAVLRELVSPVNLPHLEPGSIFVISAELWGDGAEARRPEVLRLLGEARALYPGDFVLQAASGYFYQESTRFEDAVASRSAALALRPGDLGIRQKLAESLCWLGRMVDSQAALRTCLATDPTNVDSNYLLGCVQFNLGDQVGSLASLSRVPEIAADANMSVDLAVAQYFNGMLGRVEIERRAEAEFPFNNFATLLFALLDHPIPAQRDPTWVLRALGERASTYGPSRWARAIELVARIRLEDWEGAASILESNFQRPYLPLMTPVCYTFLEALVYAHLERKVEAQQAYQRAMNEWNALTRDQTESWERSDAMRWRREAEGALEKK